MYNLRNRSFLKELDFSRDELLHLLNISQALKTAKYAGNEVQREFMSSFAERDQMDESAQSRFQLTRDALDCMVKNPVFGCGLENWGNVAPEYGWPRGKRAHNPWAEVGATLGVRPEHLSITPTGWRVDVETIEMLGAERLLYGRMEGESLVIRTDEGDACPALGSTIHVTPKAGRLHWFDSATGQRLP